MPVITYRQALNDTLGEELARDPNVLLMGEEIGVFQGSYRITEGLLQEFGPKRVVEPMRCALVVNGADAYEAACVAGLGLIQAPVHGVQALVNQGLLAKVMPDFTAPPMPVSLLYPHRKHMAPRVSACVNWLAQVIERHLTQVGQ